VDQKQRVSDNAITQRLDELEKTVAMVAKERDGFLRERDEYKKLYLEMMERCRKLEIGLRSAKSERVPHEAQLSFSVLSMMLDDRARANLADASARGRRPGGARAHAAKADRPQADRLALSNMIGERSRSCRRG